MNNQQQCPQFQQNQFGQNYQGNPFLNQYSGDQQQNGFDPNNQSDGSFNPSNSHQNHQNNNFGQFQNLTNPDFVSHSNNAHQQHTRATDQPKRQSLMNINRPGYLSSRKEKIQSRLENTRRSLVNDQRQRRMNELTASKMRSGVIERDVHNHMLEQNFVKNFMMEEIGHIVDDMSIDDYIREFDQIQNELNEYLARQLIESTVYDEEFHYEKYEQHNQREADMLARTYDPNNNDFYICAVCKGQVFRVNGSIIRCEKPGCIDINLGNPNFNIETMMNLVMSEVQDHRQQSINELYNNQINNNPNINPQNIQINTDDICSDKNLKLRLVNLNEEFADVFDDEDNNNIDMNGTDQEQRDKEQQLIQGHAQGNPAVNLAVMVCCDQCHFNGIINLYD